MITRRRGQRGNALIEFALATAVLIPFLTGTFQFGYSFYAYNRLQTAVSNGARYAAMRTYRSSGGATSIDKVKAAVKNMVVYGTPSPGESPAPVVPGLTTGSVGVTYTLTGTGEPTDVQVQVNSYTLDALFSSYTFTNKPFAKFPYLGRYAPAESEP